MCNVYVTCQYTVPIYFSIQHSRMPLLCMLRVQETIHIEMISITIGVRYLMQQGFQNTPTCRLFLAITS